MMGKTMGLEAGAIGATEAPIEAAYPCPVCGKVFTNRRGMAGHLAGRHGASAAPLKGSLSDRLKGLEGEVKGLEGHIDRRFMELAKALDAGMATNFMALVGALRASGQPIEGAPAYKKCGYNKLHPAPAPAKHCHPAPAVKMCDRGKG